MKAAITIALATMAAAESLPIEADEPVSLVPLMMGNKHVSYNMLVQISQLMQNDDETFYVGLCQ